jgi:N-acetylglucosamine kinase-like BadF-type ATPase
MPPLFVGLDLGGSGTRAALADADGQVLAIGQGGTSGIVGGAAGRRLLGRALDAALAPIAARIGADACVVHAGTRGLSVPGRRDGLLLELRQRLPTADVHISNDALIALSGSLAGREGVAVLAGTGSIALARSADGREGRAGGWGYLLGDEGSGYWLGREAIAAHLHVLEGRAARGVLAQQVGEAVGVRGVPEVIAWVNSSDNPVARLAGLAPLISRAAALGDFAASDILARAGCALAELGVAAARQVWPAGGPERLNVTCCGAVWAAGSALVGPFAQALGARLPGVAVAAPLLPPVGGAILLAMTAGNAKRPDPAVLDALIEAFARRGPKRL